MWCPHCQSDVPQTADSALNQRRCLRCGQFVAANRTASVVAGSSGEREAWRGKADEGVDVTRDWQTLPSCTWTARYDEWTLAAEVQRARRLLGDRPFARLHNTRRPDAEWSQPFVGVADRRFAIEAPRTATQTVATKAGRHIEWLSICCLALAAFSGGVLCMVLCQYAAGIVAHASSVFVASAISALLLVIVLQLFLLRRVVAAMQPRLRDIELQMHVHSQSRRRRRLAPFTSRQ
jgi:hypothetical protein